ncbi:MULTISPECIES: hypothetical protein [Mycobacterium]|uniref:hypothetical protein n=1 Tax=Mycobacterium TaxID=1763 RepID=UPI000A9ACF56|nr:MULTISPECIES: hypothetical protein [Mycobacterium]
MSSHGESRFAIAAAGDGLRWRLHAVDFAVFGPRLAAAGADECYRTEIYSVCGQRCNHVATRLGPFTYGSRWLTSRRCERCGWVVALSRGTVEQEIAQYLPDDAHRDVIEAAGTDPDLMRRIFVAILADAPPGRAGEPGHRSDLLAHAARHRPAVMVCQGCSESSSAAAVHGEDILSCPHSAVVCADCTFSAGPWAGEREGMTTGECVVGAPCSVLIALAHHYAVAIAEGSDAGPPGRIVDAPSALRFPHPPVVHLKSERSSHVISQER